jgi:hypothetical protein
VRVFPVVNSPPWTTPPGLRLPPSFGRMRAETGHVEATSCLAARNDVDAIETVYRPALAHSAAAGSHSQNGVKTGGGLGNRAAASGYVRTTMATRRFWARPSRVVFGATGVS